MSNNCLVTKLKVAVDNNNLKKLGVISVNIVDSDTAQTQANSVISFYKVDTSAENVVNVVGDGWIASSFAGLSDPSVRKKTMTLGASIYGTSVYFTKGNYKLEVTNKYNISAIEVGGKNPYVKFDLSELPYVPMNTLVACGTNDLSWFEDSMDTFKRIQLKQSSTSPNKVLTGDIGSLYKQENLETIDLTLCTGVKGSIESISGLTKLHTLDVSHIPNITGNISAVSAMTNLKYLGIIGTAITGSIENLVGGLISNGRTTSAKVIDGTSYEGVNANQVLKRLSFGGVMQKIGISDNTLITWESASKIAVGIGNGTSMSNCYSVFTKGYTQEEAETAFSGKTIVRVDA